MMMQRIAWLRCLQAAGASMAVAACGGDLTLPDTTGEGLVLAVVAGNGQTGTVGDTLPAPVVVELRGSGGQLIEGHRVAFVPASAGDFAPDTVLTDGEGL